MAVQYSPDGRWFWNGSQWAPVVPGMVPMFGGFWRRLGGFVIDAVLIGVTSQVVTYALILLGAVFASAINAGSGSNSTSPAAAAIFIMAVFLPYAVAFGIPILYPAIMHASRVQATVGELALGVKVVDRSGDRIGFGRALGRSAMGLLSGFVCYFGHLVMLFTVNQQALHDLVAGTLVVRKENQPGTVPAPGSGRIDPTVGVVVVLGYVGVFLFSSLIVIVILLTMGNQIKNVFSNVVAALGPG